MKRTALVFLVLLSIPGRSQGASNVRRWALVVGTNKGDATETQLRFAASDARKLSSVLTELGGVDPADLTLLTEATATDVESALVRLASALKSATEPVKQLIVYVSSHADESVLHLRGSHLSLSRLTGFLEQAPIQIGFLVLDACYSGAVIRQKGLRPIPSSAVSIEPFDVRGRVVITSSRHEEPAQESDALAGSFFTHHFIAGLRGAADAQQDGQITLEEAYAYSYSQTVQSTFMTLGGIQHPSYHVDLKGNGAVVLTDLRRSSSRLYLDIEEPGEWLISSTAHSLATRIKKGRGGVTLALSSGEYQVMTRRADRAFHASAVLAPFGTTTLRLSDLRPGALLPAAEKGSKKRWAVSLAGSVRRAVIAGVGNLLGATLRLDVLSEGDSLISTWGAALDCHGGFSPGVVPFRQTECSLRGTLGKHTRWRAVEPFLRGEIGAIYIAQTQLPDGPRRSLVPELVASAGLRLSLGRKMFVMLDTQLGVAMLTTQRGLRGRTLAAAGLGMGWDFQ